MEEIALFGIVLRLVYATLALGAAIGTLYLFNGLTGNRFGAAYAKMADEAGLPFAIYRSALVLGVLSLYARALS
jgi:hypothetical protein